MNNQDQQTVYGVVALFDSAGALRKAAEQAGEENTKRKIGILDAHTPYPVHGLEKALRLEYSRLGYLVLAAALSGVALAWGMQLWMNALDYPLITGGKPFNSWPAWIPVIFELMVLCAAFTAFFGMLGLFNHLPFTGNPLLQSAAIRRITRDRFALVLHAARGGGAIDAQAAWDLLLRAGAQETETVFWPVRPERRPDQVPFREFAFIAAVVALATVGGWCIYWAIKLWPEMPPNIYLHQQKKLLPEAEEPFFTDGNGMRTPPYGAVARGGMPYPFEPNMDDQRAGQLLINPQQITENTLQQGRTAFEKNCLVCHGVWGDGTKSLSAQYAASPANLQSARIREYPDGRIYHVITAGKGLMPGYEPQIAPRERWLIVNYLRVLERAQNAAEADLEEALKGYVVVETDTKSGKQAK